MKLLKSYLIYESFFKKAVLWKNIFYVNVFMSSSRLELYSLFTKQNSPASDNREYSKSSFFAKIIEN